MISNKTMADQHDNQLVAEPKADSGSYHQILKSSSLIGGAQGVNLLLGMVRVKFAAVLIGPLGVGLAANYMAVQGVVGTVAGLGIQSSAVRDVAEAVGRGDQEAVGRAVLSLRRVCWLTGLAGALAIALLSGLLSRWTFGSDEHTIEIALLGLTLLFSNISGGQTALLQGVRRIGDLAILNLVGAASGTVITIGFYLWLGLRGIIPALILAAFAQLVASWYFARRVPVPPVAMSWRQSLQAAGGMVRLGLVFMWNGLLGSLVAYCTRVLITQQIDLAAVGIFSAAFALSGMFVNFVLQAMGADYYPRLTAVAGDRSAMNRLVNEQTEIGLLLAVPGLLATLCLAPWIVRLFYTVEFLPAVELLQWFVLGCLGRVISWPLGFIMLALGKGRWFFVTETLFNGLHMALIAAGLLVMGIEGVALAFFILYLLYIATVYWVGHRLTAFRWSSGVQRMLIVLLTIVALSFVAARLVPLWPATVLGLVSSLVATVICLRGLVKRIGQEHRIVRAACRVPGMRFVCGL